MRSDGKAKKSKGTKKARKANGNDGGENSGSGNGSATVKKDNAISDRTAEAAIIANTVPSSSQHWPTNVMFLASHSQPSSKLPPLLQLELCLAPRLAHETHPFSICHHAWTYVDRISHTTPFVPAYASALTQHPAVGQFGLFAQKDIPPRTLVVPYLGLVHLAGQSKGDEDEHSQYDAAVEAHDGTMLGIDATHMGSDARFVNDYRGILHRPNLFFQQWSAPFPRNVLSVNPSAVDAGKESGQRDGVVRLPTHVRGLAFYSGAHPIKAGTELCASYGKGWWAARQAHQQDE